MPSSFDPANFDPAIRPADDFFHYVNGGWIKRNPIPDDEAWWGSFNVLRVDVEQQLKDILESVAAKDDFAPGSDGQRIRDFYRTAMDMEKRNRLGIAPLAELFAKIDAVPAGAGAAGAAGVADELANIVGFLQRHGVERAWWAAFVEQDEKKSEVMILHLYQGGLGLPDRDYYLNADEKSKKIRADYLIYIGKMLERLGPAADIAIADLAGASAKILEIETRLAEASSTRVELRDVEKQYNKMTPAELAVIAPRIDWQKYFAAIGIAAPEYLIVGQPKFFAVVDHLFETLPLGDIKMYLRWQVLRSFSACLAEDMERQQFDFYGRTFQGAREMKPLWRRVFLTINDALGEMLGKLYVERHFSEDAKRKINLLVDHLAAAYRARIEKLDWMTPETKQKAVEKLEMVSRKLGYPDIWLDTSALTVGTDSYAQNYMRAYMFEFDRKARQAGGPVDRMEWFMTPQTVNAYYQPPLNEIAFPAAILQPPFFDPNADDAVNFGGIGTVIGHELTHGLDDQGALFDAHGNLNNWWTPEDKEQFQKKAAHLAEQFDKYEPLPGTFVNGKLTLGENIADLGGVLIAYDALRLALQDQPKNIPVEGVPQSVPLVGAPTPIQQFFISYAITEREHEREERQRLALQIDPHSPSEYRVNGPLSNMKEFYEAFGAKPGDKLWRESDDRVQIW